MMDVVSSSSSLFPNIKMEECRSEMDFPSALHMLGFVSQIVYDIEHPPAPSLAIVADPEPAVDIEPSFVADPKPAIEMPIVEQEIIPAPQRMPLPFDLNWDPPPSLIDMETIDRSAAITTTTTANNVDMENIDQSATTTASNNVALLFETNKQDKTSANQVLVSPNHESIKPRIHTMAKTLSSPIDCTLFHATNHKRKSESNYYPGESSKARQITKKLKLSTQRRPSAVFPLSQPQQNLALPAPVPQPQQNQEGGGTNSKAQRRSWLKIVFRTPPPPPPQPQLPDEFKNKISELGGTIPKLVIEKPLSNTDMNDSQSRLSMPYLQCKVDLHYLERERKVIVIQPKNNLEVKELTFTRWDSNSLYIFKTRWNKFAKSNGLKEGDKIQVWSFKQGDETSFAIVKLPEQD